jgi:hypothetical protein
MKPPALSDRLVSLLLAIWTGGGVFFLAVAAPAAFASSPTRSAAANVVGAMLSRWHYLAILAPLILLVVEWKRGFPRDARWVLVVAALFFACAEAVVDLRIRSIRRSSPVPISELAPGNPVRRQFGALHGISTLLAGANVLAGVFLLMRRDSYRHESTAEPGTIDDDARNGLLSESRGIDDLDR